MAFRALGVKAGDEILVPSHTAFPTVEALCFAEATPVFVDVDAWYGMDVADAAAKVTPRTVGIVPVHIYGQPVDVPGVRDLASRYGLWMLEDCCQAHGAAWDGRKVGGFGRAAAFSFYPSKNLTVMGDGGAVVTDDDEIAARCRRLRDHGRLNKDVHAEVGFNLRFNDIQAAIGRVLLRRLDMMNERRRQLARRYAKSLDGLPLELPRERPGARHVYHLFTVRHAQRDALAKRLADAGVGTAVHYPRAVPDQPVFAADGERRWPEAYRAAREVLSLPCYSEMTDDEVEGVVDAVRTACEELG